MPSFGNRANIDDEEGEEENEKRWMALIALCALGILISYADRSNISVAIIGMAQEFKWDKVLEGYILSSFFAGYAATQLLGGRMADLFGGKWVLAAGLAVWSFATFITPSAAFAGTIPLIAVRIFLGLGEGVAFPAVHSIISRSVPRSKQSLAVGIVTAASYAGAALAFLIVPSIIQNFGWPTSFLGFGAAAFLWLPAWLALDHGSSRASQKLEQSMQTSKQETTSITSSLKELLPLFKTREVIAICITQFCGSWGLYGLLSWLPTFFSEQYGVALSELPALTFVPYVLQAAVGMVVGKLADETIAAGTPVATVRKGLQVAGMVIPAVTLLLAASPITGGSATVGSLLIDLGLAANALTLGAVSVSHLDIAPRNAGAVFGLGNTFATLAGFLSVPVTGFLLDKTGSWAVVFGVIAMNYILGAIAFASWSGSTPLKEDGGVKELKVEQRELVSIGH